MRPRHWQQITAGTALAAACSVPASASTPTSVEDIAVCMNFQGPRAPELDTDFFRGRLLLAGYLDDDEYVDFVFGNPGDQSFVTRTVPSDSPGCAVELEVVQVLSDRGLYWSGGLADLDNDGDLDLFIGAGGNENAEPNVYWRNEYVETGILSFVDVTATGATFEDGDGNVQAVSIARHSWHLDIDGDGTPGNERLATSGVNFADVNNDAWIDIFLSGNTTTPGPDSCVWEICGRNTLWLNNGDGTFTDATISAGLGDPPYFRTRHSTFLDYDNDGDRDLLVNNYLGPNALYENQWLETGEVSFREVTGIAVAPGEDARFPWDSFGSRALDVNHDGTEDFMFATRAPRRDFIQTDGDRVREWVDCGGEEIAESGALEGPLSLAGPYPERDHALFVSGPGGYRNNATEYGVNDRLVPVGGVMGWQTGDLNADGVADICEVRGAPASGQNVYLLLSDSEQPFGTIRYLNHSPDLNKLDVPRDPNVPLNLYDRWKPGELVKLRGHGTVMIDVDHDGTLELLTSNGGATFPDGFGDVREINRVYKFTWPTPRQYFKLFLEGDGVTVNRNAIGAKAALKVTDSTGSRTLFQSVYGTHAFSAQAGFELYFGLGEDPSVTVDRITIFWPDGHVQFVDEGLEPNTRLVVPRQPAPCSQAATCGLSRAEIASIQPSPPEHNGAFDDEYLVGDWDGDGCDNLAVRRGSVVLMDTNFDGAHDLELDFGAGNAEDEYLVGDWNGDGCDDLAVRQGDTIAMETDFDGQVDDTVVTGAGADADDYLVGDIEGLGAEAIATRIGNDVAWDRSPWDGVEDGTTKYGGGASEDEYLIGRWSDSGLAQTLAVRRDNVVLLNFDLDGAHDLTQTFGLGELEDEYLVGDWDGDGRDNLAVRQGNVISMDHDFDDEVDQVQVYGAGTED